MSPSWFRGPSWREAFFLLLSFTTVSAVAWGYLLSGSVRTESGFAESWFELWERCRISIETRTPLDESGLQPLSIVESPSVSVVVPDNERVLGRPGGRFAIVEVEFLNGDDLAQRGCKVAFQDWRRPVTETEMGLLMLAFMRQRTALVGAGTHEFRDPAMTGAVVSVGFGPIDLNPVGCEVIASIFSSAEAATFSSLITERSHDGGGCGAPSLLNPPQQFASGNASITRPLRPRLVRRP